MTSLEGIESDAQMADELTAVKRERDRLARQLFDIKHRRMDYLDAVTEAAEGAIRQITIRPVPRRTPSGAASGPEEVAVALLSDLQTGKRTPDYDSEVCRARVMRYAEKIVRITEIQRHDHPVKHLVVPALGDMVEGVDIFPGQQWLLDSTLYRQVFETTPSIIVDFVRYLLQHFDTVTMEAVQGNHGRLGRKGTFGPEDNADRMVYRLVGLLLRDEPRFIMNMADPEGERAWYKIMHIGNYSAMLIHGDQIRGANGYPWYGLGKKVHSWASGGVPETFQDIMLGHYHQLAMVPLNKRVAWANGSTESTNTFASEMLAAQSDPSQWLLYVNPETGKVTSQYAVRLLEE